MVEEVLRFLAVKPEGVYVDATVGTGGHAAAILERLTTGRLIGVDKDPMALEFAQERLKPYQRDLQLVRSSYAQLPQVLEPVGPGPVDGLLADLGVSSLQLDAPERGFSFRRAGPLDMRMDPASPVTAADIVNRARESELAELLDRYGEERHAKKIARQIVGSRPVRDTLHLAQVVTGIRKPKGRQKLHPATRTFLALRIAVNREQEELEQFLLRVPVYLKLGGRVVILSYHSLEDRLVKHLFRQHAAAHELQLLTKKVVRPTPGEVRANPRVRSARLRAAERIRPE
ncbi:16S rRNA (cytosine(1402)-N(4))-methyltransferase RsmH [Acidobacteriia bacterium AH_259_A11_L15]|nr:16S rRNA (cytosine(1402)-N(4))-methyltransferase RsmH [Acidobacteriia bacterium AH_259_A11_L15]